MCLLSVRILSLFVVGLLLMSPLVLGQQEEDGQLPPNVDSSAEQQEQDSGPPASSLFGNSGSESQQQDIDGMGQFRRKRQQEDNTDVAQQVQDEEEEPQADNLRRKRQDDDDSHGMGMPPPPRQESADYHGPRFAADNQEITEQAEEEQPAQLDNLRRRKRQGGIGDNGYAAEGFGGQQAAGSQEENEPSSFGGMDFNGGDSFEPQGNPQQENEDNEQ